MYYVKKGLKCFRVEDTDIEDVNLSGLAEQISENPELVLAYHLGEINLSSLKPKKAEILEDYLRKAIIGEEIEEHYLCNKDEF